MLGGSSGGCVVQVLDRRGRRVGDKGRHVKAIAFRSIIKRTSEKKASAGVD